MGVCVCVKFDFNVKLVCLLEISLLEAANVEVVTLVASLSKAWAQDLETLMKFVHGQMDKLLGGILFGCLCGTCCCSES